MSVDKRFSRREIAAGALAALMVPSTFGGVSGAVRVAKGIRYARAERFRAPESVRFDHEAMVVPGTFAAACPQSGTRYLPQSEDCLFLNVWSPATQTSARLPVMIYFHGGAYSSGSVTDPMNDGAKLASHGNVVVVTVNHRLNCFGYLYLARLDARFPDSGNLGQLDLIRALQWVQLNIERFGGDPANVTLFGQSGGGAKIATLMAMPAAAGLFHKAITMSGQQVTASGPLNATKRAKVFLAALGEIDPVDATVEQLKAAMAAEDPMLGGALYMGPVLDMRNLHRHPFWPDAAPQSDRIPMLLGNTIAETRAFYSADSATLANLSMENLASRIASEMRIDAHPEWVVAEFRQRYPTDDALTLFHRIVTAARSWRGQIVEAEVRAKVSAATFVYQLDFDNAMHTDDIGLSFGTIASPTAAQTKMSQTLMKAFVRFAYAGDPGWARYELEQRQTMIFDRISRVVEDPRRWERELFERIPYIQPGT